MTLESIIMGQRTQHSHLINYMIKVKELAEPFLFSYSNEDNSSMSSQIEVWLYDYWTEHDHTPFPVMEEAK
jgi:hypothetical protein